MMSTMFLATVLGWYMVIFGLLMLVRHDFVKLAMTEIFAERGLYFMLAIITLILGLLIVASHNIWVMDWPVIVTLFAWFIVAGAIFRLFFSEAAHRMGKSFLKSKKKMKVMGIVFLVIGVYLLIHIYGYHIHF